ncbi:unnamed protein product [Trichogramma brassicae]|uniref:Uncharacterized protein n=1 Tax=Trichogramma brassicae TaxID=86971 RepID=A0A6H5IBG0_9HYME|nr:unnamed protein product [Trichogramma brassicae]
MSFRPSARARSPRGKSCATGVLRSADHRPLISSSDLTFERAEHVHNEHESIATTSRNVNHSGFTDTTMPRYSEAEVDGLPSSSGANKKTPPSEHKGRATFTNPKSKEIIDEESDTDVDSESSQKSIEASQGNENSLLPSNTHGNGRISDSEKSDDDEDEQFSCKYFQYLFEFQHENKLIFSGVFTAKSGTKRRVRRSIMEDEESVKMANPPPERTANVSTVKPALTKQVQPTVAIRRLNKEQIQSRNMKSSDVVETIDLLDDNDDEDYINPSQITYGTTGLLVPKKEPVDAVDVYIQVFML